MKKIIKVICIVFSSIISLILISIALIAFIFRNEISAISSIELRKPRVENSLQCGIYEMTYKGDYYFDDFIKQGGTKSDTEFLTFIRNKMTKGLLNTKLYIPKVGCSSFTARTFDGQRLFARNYDLYSTNTCILRVKGNKKRHASVSSVDLSFLDIPAKKDIDNLMLKALCLSAPYISLDGINDAGISCGIYMSNQGAGNSGIPTNQNTDRPDLSSTSFLRMILDYADSIEDAVEIAKNYDMHDSGRASYHYMVADRTGRSVIFEWVNGTDKTDNFGAKRKLTITYNDGDSHIGPREAASDFQWITNFIIQPGYYADSSESAMVGLDRYNILYDELSKCNGVVADEMAAMEVLHKVSQRTIRPKRAKNDTILTIHSVIYNLDEKTVLWCGNEQYADKDGMFRYKYNSKKKIFE